MSYGRFPEQYPLQPVQDGLARAAAEVVIALAAEHVAGASLPYRGDNGDYALFTAETVTFSAGADTPETVLEAERAEWTDDVFFTLENDDAATAQEVFMDDARTRLEGGHMDRIRAAARNIGSGAIAGEGSRRAVRFLERPQDTGPIILETTVSSGSERGEKPITTVNLELTRLYDNDQKIAQYHRVTYDANTGLYHTGSAINSAFGPGDAAVQVGREQQARFRPALPVDRHLTPAEWMDLIRQPLNPADRLQHS
jgi:hypothetical protein